MRAFYAVLIKAEAYECSSHSSWEWIVGAAVTGVDVF